MPVQQKHPYASAAAFITHPKRLGQILVGERYYKVSKGKEFEYVIAGGKVDWMEKVEDAVVREVLEETGLKVKVKRYLGFDDDMWPDLNIHFVCHYFQVVYVSGTVTDVEPEKQRNWKWVDATKCPTLYGKATLTLLRNMKYFTEKKK